MVFWLQTHFSTRAVCLLLLSTTISIMSYMYTNICENFALNLYRADVYVSRDTVWTELIATAVEAVSALPAWYMGLHIKWLHFRHHDVLVHGGQKCSIASDGQSFIPICSDHKRSSVLTLCVLAKIRNLTWVKLYSWCSRTRHIHCGYNAI